MESTAERAGSRGLLEDSPELTKMRPHTSPLLSKTWKEQPVSLLGDSFRWHRLHKNSGLKAKPRS